MTCNVENERRKGIMKSKVPFGFVYKVTNTKNGKIHIGKVEEGRKGKGKTAIEKRWNAQIERAHRFHRWNREYPLKKKQLRYIENAINKYGEKCFSLEGIDIAFSKKELNEKERYWIQYYETRNHSKGFHFLYFCCFLRNFK